MSISSSSYKLLPLIVAIGASLALQVASAQVSRPAVNPAVPPMTPPAQNVADPKLPEQPTIDTTPLPNTAASASTDASANASTQTSAGESTASTKGRAKASESTKAKSGSKGWTELDANGDGNLSKAEAAGNPDMARVFAQADKNHDGILTPDEYRSYYTANVSHHK